MGKRRNSQAPGEPPVAQPTAEGEAAQRTILDDLTPEQREPLARPVARVGNTVVDLMRLFIFSRNKPETHALLGTREGRAEVLAELIENRLLNMAAVEEAGLEPGFSTSELTAATKQLEQKHLTMEEVSDEVVKAYYEANRHRLGIPAAIRVREIFFPVAPGAAAEGREAVVNVRKRRCAESAPESLSRCWRGSSLT